VDCGDWKEAKLHADCYVSGRGDYYSAAHPPAQEAAHQITENQVELFLGLERLAIHPRSRHRNGKRIFIDAHFPPPPGVLRGDPAEIALRRGSSIPNKPVVRELFNTDVYGNIRRCQGFVRSCTKEINQSVQLASERIARRSPPCAGTPSSACRTSRRCSPRRANRPLSPSGRDIVRRPGNPMLRYARRRRRPR